MTVYNFGLGYYIIIQYGPIRASITMTLKKGIGYFSADFEEEKKGPHVKHEFLFSKKLIPSGIYTLHAWGRLSHAYAVAIGFYSYRGAAGIWS